MPNERRDSLCAEHRSFDDSYRYSRCILQRLRRRHLRFWSCHRWSNALGNSLLVGILLLCTPTPERKDFYARRLHHRLGSGLRCNARSFTLRQYHCYRTLAWQQERKPCPVLVSYGDTSNPGRGFARCCKSYEAWCRGCCWRHLYACINSRLHLCFRLRMLGLQVDDKHREER